MLNSVGRSVTLNPRPMGKRRFMSMLSNLALAGGAIVLLFGGEFGTWAGMCVICCGLSLPGS
jgi:hypothetical protein